MPSSSLIDADAAEKIFERKGLVRGERFSLGDWTLIQYPKMAVQAKNYHRDPDGVAVFSCGTVVYRSLGYRDSLHRLLADFRENCLDQDELIGNFSLLFFDGRLVHLLTDRLNAQHVFANDERTCVSTSFLAVAAANPTAMRLNLAALYEKLATGILISPDTLVEGIDQLNDEMLEGLNQANGLVAIAHAPMAKIRMHHGGFSDSVNRQVAILQKYFGRFSVLEGEYHAELGLSDGYDSRLLLALSQVFDKPIPLHSHHTLNVHESELKVSRRLAAIGGNSHTVISTVRTDEVDEAPIARPTPPATGNASLGNTV